MKVFAYDIKPLSGFRSWPRASTLWGHLAWAIRELKGEHALSGWIDAHRSAIDARSDPPVKLSSAFPKNTLPRPILPPVLVADTIVRKQLKAIRWLPIEIFEHVAAGGEAKLVELIEAGDLPPVSSAAEQTASRTRVAMDRRTGAAAKGLLFEEVLYWYSGTLTIYAQTSDVTPPKQLAELIDYVGSNGYAGGSSTGNGHFQLIEGPREVRLPGATNGTHDMLLGPGLLPENPSGWWRTETYWGRMGNVFALASTPFKKPYLRLIEGSVLQDPNPALLNVTPPTEPQNGVKIWENLYPLTLPLEVHRG